MVTGGPSKTGFVSEVFASFQGEGPRVGERHLFVRFAGCHIRCQYCDTPESLVRTPACRIDRGPTHPLETRANPLSSAAVRALIDERIAAEPFLDAIAITGGEPLVQAAFLAEVLAGTRWKVPVLLETSGTQPLRLVEVLDRVDIISMDLKLPSNSGERAFWAVHEEFLVLAARRELYVKVLVDRGTSADEVERAAALVAATAPEVPVYLQPITLAGGGVDVDGATLALFHARVRAHVARARILPQTHKMLRIA